MHEFLRTIMCTHSHTQVCIHTRSPSFSCFILKIGSYALLVYIVFWASYAFEFVTSRMEIHFYEPGIVILFNDLHFFISL